MEPMGIKTSCNNEETSPRAVAGLWVTAAEQCNRQGCYGATDSHRAILNEGQHQKMNVSCLFWVGPSAKKLEG